MTSSKKPQRYEFTPARMVLPGIPLPAPGLTGQEPQDAGHIEFPKRISIRGLATPATTVDRAQREAKELLREYGQRHRRGDRSALYRLLEINAEFIAVPLPCGAATQHGPLARRDTGGGCCVAGRQRCQLLQELERREEQIRRAVGHLA